MAVATAVAIASLLAYVAAGKFIVPEVVPLTVILNGALCGKTYGYSTSVKSTPHNK